MTKPALMMAAVLALAAPALATPKVSGDGACGVRAVDNESFLSCDGNDAPEPVGIEESRDLGFPAAIPVTARQAWQVKRDLGSRVLLVDIRSRPEIAYTGMPIGADANVTFMRPAAGLPVIAASGRLAMELNPRFLEQMDGALAAAGLRHGDAVIVLDRSGNGSRLAAELLHEHGYLQVFAITDGFESWLHADAQAAVR
jgi:rhodanese-related sulfurtransferase